MLEHGPEHGGAMGSVYKIVELVGTSEVYREIWEHGRIEAQVAEQEVA